MVQGDTSKDLAKNSQERDAAVVITVTEVALVTMLASLMS